jgi:hypothetical protein
MSKRKRLLSNTKAREMSESELTQILRDYFKEVNGISPSSAQEEGLHETAQGIKEGWVEWSRAELGIADETWDPADGPRAIYSSG